MMALYCYDHDAPECDKRCPDYKACRKECREARKHFCKEGMINLVNAFLQYFSRDYNGTKEPGTKQYLEKCCCSPDFEALTGLEGAAILDTLKRNKRKNRKKVKTHVDD